MSNNISLYEYATRKHNNCNHWFFFNHGNVLPFLENNKHHSVVPGTLNMAAKGKISCSQLWAILPLREHLAVSGDSFGFQTLGEGVVTHYRIEAKDVAKHHTMRSSPQQRILTPKCQ